MPQIPDDGLLSPLARHHIALRHVIEYVPVHLYELRERSRMRIRRETWPPETYTVTIRHDRATNVVVSERWEKDGREHRDHGPALISRDAVTGMITDEKWLRQGQLHREEGPADILRKPDGRVYYSAWYRDGEKIPALRPGRRPRKSPVRNSPPPSP